MSKISRGVFYLLLVLNAALVSGAEIPQACKQQCVTQYGEVLGKAPGGVEAYSNCNSSCVVFQPQHYEGTYTGIQWQCVEYTRRWLLVNRGVVYGDVDYAIDIWDKITAYKRISDDKLIATENMVNGSERMPLVGDLFIYARVMFAGTGHSAVVIEVDRKRQVIKLAEQNNLNEKWPADYAREVPYVVKARKYWVLDSYLIGWKRMKSTGDSAQAVD